MQQNQTSRLAFKDGTVKHAEIPERIGDVLHWPVYCPPQVEFEPDINPSNLAITSTTLRRVPGTPDFEEVGLSRTVSALMATTPARDKFRPRSIDSFYRQRFPSDWKVSLYINDHPTHTLGRKLNEMVARSTSEYFLVWDDDDVYSPTRLTRQIQPLIDGYDYSGTSQILYHDIRTDEGWQYTGNGSWLGALAFTRAAWNRLRFNDTTAGVDNQWQMNLQGKGFDLKDPALLIASIHQNNACKKHTVGSNWSRAVLPEFPRV